MYHPNKAKKNLLNPGYNYMMTIYASSNYKYEVLQSISPPKQRKS